jgi:hypothetical protein
MHTSFKATFVVVLGLSSVVTALPGGVPTYGGGGSSSTQGGGVNTCSPTTVTITKKGGGHVGTITKTETEISTVTKKGKPPFR